MMAAGLDLTISGGDGLTTRVLELCLSGVEQEDSVIEIDVVTLSSVESTKRCSQ